MSGPAWDYFWPIFAFGAGLALICGVVAFRRRNKWPLITVAAILVLAGTALWHGPLGAADRFSAKVEAGAQEALAYYEMTQVTAKLHHGPLTRRLMLSGNADDFQRSELERLLGQLAGVSKAEWGGFAGLPLLLEAEIVGAMGFLAGLLVAYVIDVRRRYNAQWKW
jgi:hypothetical protein